MTLNGVLVLLNNTLEFAAHVQVANRCCEGRIVSVLEGGYRIQGGPVSAFGRSVACHVRALLDGCTVRQQWSAEDAEWEVCVRRTIYMTHVNSTHYRNDVVK